METLIFFENKKGKWNPKFVKEEKNWQNSGETPIVALSGFSYGWRGEGSM